MHPTTSAPRELSTRLLATCEAEYRDLVETWRGIETKGQGITAVCGIFLAAMAGFIRNPTVASVATFRIGIAVVTVLLLIAVVLGVLALRIRIVPRPPAGTRTRQLITELLAMPESEWEERSTFLLNDLAGLWFQVNHGLSTANENKAKMVRLAQSTLAASILAFGLLILYLLKTT